MKVLVMPSRTNLILYTSPRHPSGRPTEHQLSSLWKFSAILQLMFESHSFTYVHTCEIEICLFKVSATICNLHQELNSGTTSSSFSS